MGKENIIESFAEKQTNEEIYFTFFAKNSKQDIVRDPLKNVISFFFLINNNFMVPNY